MWRKFCAASMALARPAGRTFNGKRGGFWRAWENTV